MTDKELRKLSRKDLLQLMLESVREADKSRKQLEETERQMAALEKNYERLRKRLDQKDAQIHDLKVTLQAERQKRDIELTEAGSIAAAALKLNGIFEAAQKAAEQYVYNVKRLSDEKRGVEPEECPDIKISEAGAIRVNNAGVPMKGEDSIAVEDGEEDPAIKAMREIRAKAQKADYRAQAAEQNKQRESDGQGERTESGKEEAGASFGGSDRGGASERTA